MKTPQLNGLQFLRFVAAALVVATHSTLYVSERFQAMPLWLNGTRGVDVFFVISGFVMVWTSSHLVGQRHGAATFMAKRIKRIVPLYWFATGAKALMMLGLGGLALHSTFDPALIAKSLFFIPARKASGEIEPLLGVGWTLNFEMAFYVIFAASFAFRRRSFEACCLVLTTIAIASAWRPHAFPVWQFYLNDIVLEFLFGMVIARYFMLQRAVPRALSTLLLIAGAGWTLWSDNSLGLPRCVDFGIPAAMIVFATIALEREVGPHISPGMLFLGNASYAIYLFHPLLAPAGAVIAGRLHLPGSLPAVALCWMIGIGAGCLAHRFAEPVVNRLWRSLFDGGGAMLPGQTPR